MHRLLLIVLLGTSACSAVGGQTSATAATVTTVIPAAAPTSATNATTIVVPTSGDVLDLQQAERSAVEGSGPYAYVTARVVCDSCSGDDVLQMYFVPGSADRASRKLAQLWLNDAAVAPSDLSQHVAAADETWLNDVTLVPGTLLAAVEDGHAVGWSVEPTSFLIESWQIDGAGLFYECFEVDTAPIEQRDGRCSGGFLGRG